MLLFKVYLFKFIYVMLVVSIDIYVKFDVFLCIYFVIVLCIVYVYMYK